MEYYEMDYAKYVILHFLVNVTILVNAMILHLVDVMILSLVNVMIQSLTK